VRRVTTTQATTTETIAAVEPDYTATLATKRMAASVLFTSPDGRVLLVEPTYKDYWEIPGGAVEAGESPRAAALREVGEELRLDRPVAGVLAVDWVPPRPPRTEGLIVVFDGGTLTDADTASIQIPADELRSWAWCTLQEAAERLSPLLARRVTAAVAARDASDPAYLENGNPVT
jgi:8-oxo-dGTP diphosphatase